MDECSGAYALLEEKSILMEMLKMSAFKNVLELRGRKEFSRTFRKFFEQLHMKEEIVLCFGSISFRKLLCFFNMESLGETFALGFSGSKERVTTKAECKQQRKHNPMFFGILHFVTI